MPFEPSKIQASDSLNNIVPLTVTATTRGIFAQTNEIPTQSLAIFTTKSVTERELAKVKVPIVSSAFGNSMVFSFQMKDNYSAGEQVNYLLNSYSSVANSKNAEGAFWQTDVPYCDYYGRAYYCDIDIGNIANEDYPWWWSEGLTCSYSKDMPFLIENGLVKQTNSISLNDYFLRKDSREKLKFNIEIEYITNRQDLIIGSLAQNNTLVTTKTRSTPARIYFFDEKISRYKKSLFINENDSIDNLIGSYDITVNADNISFEIPSDIASFAAWAIAFPPSKKTSKMYNEETDEVEDIPEYIDGEILIACNNGSDYYTNNDNQTSETIYFKAYRDKIKD